ncbi:hypothetical protein [Rhizobium sp. AN69]|nr:hypothetical protein [Rhizobium sp. AN69]
MLPVSYRASSAFYPQRASFIELRETKVVELMRTTHAEELLQKLAAIHSIPYQEPSDAEIEAILEKAGKQEDWDEYTFLRKTYQKRAEGAPDRADLGNAMRKLREGWFDAGLLERGRLQSEAIEARGRNPQGLGSEV